MLTPSIVIENDQITPALAAIDASLTNTLPLMQDLGEYLVKSTTDRFPTGRAPNGSIWAPKSQVTIDRQGGRGNNRTDRRPLFGPSGALSSKISYEASTDQVLWARP